jgi:hypothetical protein
MRPARSALTSILRALVCCRRRQRAPGELDEVVGDLGAVFVEAGHSVGGGQDLVGYQNDGILPGRARHAQLAAVNDRGDEGRFIHTCRSTCRSKAPSSG